MMKAQKGKGKIMSLKKRMFRSNMMILFAALFSLMLIILAILVVFEDSLENQIHAIGQTKMERHIGEVKQLMASDDIRSAKDLDQKIGKWNYQTAVLTKGEITSGNRGKQMEDLAEFLQEEEIQSGKTEIYSFQKASVAVKHLPEQESYLAAAYFPEGNWIASSLKDSFVVFLAALLLAGMGAIMLLLFLASFFTRRMNRMVMEPLELLVEGAQRIKNGNLQERIEYRGEAEFEHVCETFNDMQSTILKDQEQRVKTERARIDMVTGISHDLRTPLTAIQGYIKGVLDGVADTESKRKVYLQTAYESTEEMNLLLKKLFDFSRMESGQMPFHMVSVDLSEYVMMYAAQKEAVSDPAKLRIRFRKKKEFMPEISMDVEQVRRILDNLLENSVKYAMAAPVCVDLSIEETKKFIRLSWKDNGQGVPEEKLERIFERFYRCDEARKEKGSGVGLYVVKYIMERHNGAVKAENDSGLKISLYFPKSKG
mgnify:CR=1 FL=1